MLLVNIPRFIRRRKQHFLLNLLIGSKINIAWYLQIFYSSFLPHLSIFCWTCANLTLTYRVAPPLRKSCNLVTYKVALWAHGYEYNGHRWWQAYWKLIHRSPPTTSLCPVNFSSLGSNEMRLARPSGRKHQQTTDQPLLIPHRNSVLIVYRTRFGTSSLKL